MRDEYPSTVEGQYCLHPTRINSNTSSDRNMNPSNSLADAIFALAAIKSGGPLTVAKSSRNSISNYQVEFNSSPDLTVCGCLKLIADNNIKSVLARSPPDGYDIYFNMPLHENQIGTAYGNEKISDSLANLAVITPIRFTIMEVEHTNVDSGLFLESFNSK